ncbi:hypothetical protein PR048_012848 [Dryococelus australis]|uniref:Uncharacterized protein n=1 Tax=Dryococelus australis TaxID=614101 RepID=A0ABQ9HQJ5_9NEOP|nr:hypothetical protein PR048_012848 [Dryococelus australis]
MDWHGKKVTKYEKLSEVLTELLSVETDGCVVKICELQTEYKCPSNRKFKACYTNINHTCSVCEHWPCLCVNVLLLQKWAVECGDD